MTKTIQFSIATGGYKYLFKPLIRTQRQYAANCGYYYYCLDKVPWAITPSIAAWLKVGLILKFMDLGYDNIFFVDADCSIAKSTPPIFDLVDLQHKPMWIARGKSNRYNSGVIAIANTDTTKDFIKKLLANGHIPVPSEDEAPYENGHFIHYLKKNDTVGLLEHEKWNNNSALNPYSYIQHYSGGNLRKYYNSSMAPRRAYLILQIIGLTNIFRPPSASFKASTIGNQINVLIDWLAASKEHKKWLEGLRK
jgi:hypothetical protein